MGLAFLQQLNWSPNPCRHCTPEDKFQDIHARGAGCDVCRHTGYGPQLDVLLADSDEVFVGGPRGWGKSRSCQAWLVGGNPYEPDGELRTVKVAVKGRESRTIVTGGVNYSYVYHPEYRALVTRKSEDDLDAWVEAFRSFAEAMGGRFVGRPDYQFRFPDRDGVVDGGGVIALSHLRDPSSYMKYQGLPQFQRWQPEEISQLPDSESYENVMTCLRTSPKNGMRVQTLATANPEGPGVCVPYGEVLTPDGFRDIRDINLGDEVYTLRPDGSLLTSPVTDIQAVPWAGELYEVSRRGFHMSVTPDHRVAYIPTPKNHTNRDFFRIKPANALPRDTTVLRTAVWQGVSPERTYVGDPSGKHRQPSSLPTGDYCTLLGWYLSEGHVVPRDLAFGISQTKTDHRTTIRELLDRCRFVYSESDSGFLVYSPEWYEHFRQFGKAEDKHVPDEVKGYSREHLSLLFQALMDGDGVWGRGGSSRSPKRVKWQKSGVYYTISSKLADDVCELAFKLGYVVSVGSRERGAMTICGRGPYQTKRCYEVSFKTSTAGGTEIRTLSRVYSSIAGSPSPRKSGFTTRSYSGMVYCITVPNTHNFVLRQRGHVWVSGNCWVANRFVKLKDIRGADIPPGTVIEDNREDLLTGKIRSRTRVYITGSLLDNPQVAEGYIANLNATSDPRRRRALLLGDWSYATGNFFPEFRYEHLSGEPDNAYHLYDPEKVDLKPWWRRGIGVDWGYTHNAVALFGCEDPNTGRFYIESELSVRQTGARKLGVMIAERAAEILDKAPYTTIPLFLSHEAFGKKNEEGGVTRIAKMIELGIKSVLGETAASSSALELHELADAAGMEYTEFVQKNIDVKAALEARKRYGVVIYRAHTDHQTGWALMHEMMRWDSDITKEIPEFDWDTWQRLGREISAHAAMEYAHKFDPQLETRPELQIAPDCKQLIRGIRGAYTDEKIPERISKAHYDGRDALDAARYLLCGMALSRRTEQLPPEEQWAIMVDHFKRTNPGAGIGRLHQAAELWENQGFGKPQSDAVFGRLRSHSLTRRSRLNSRFN